MGQHLSNKEKKQKCQKKKTFRKVKKTFLGSMSLKKVKKTFKKEKRFLKNAKTAIESKKGGFQKGKSKKGLNIKRPPFLALASSSTFLYSVQKGLYNDAIQSKLGQSLTHHQGINTLNKRRKDF